MKPVLAMALAGLAAAQDVAQIPNCAQGCVTKFTTSGGVAGCEQADIKCVCSNTSFLGNIACCLKGACSNANQKSTVDYAKTLCSSAGVQVPDKVECPEGAANSSGSASSSSETGTATGSSSTGSATGSPSSEPATGSSSASSSTSKPSTATAAGIGGVGSVAGAVLAMLAAL